MNVLMILEDALRPSHLGCYGYTKNTSPNIDRLAQEGVMCTQAIATGSHTIPGVFSLFTGLDSASHSIVNAKRFAAWKYENLWKNRRTPLHEVKENGYLLDGEIVMRYEHFGFTRDTDGNKMEDYFETHRNDNWFFIAEPYPTHLPYNPPDEYYKLFLGSNPPADRETAERLKTVRSKLIVSPTHLTSKLEAGEKDPLPDSSTDAAHKRTFGKVDLLPEDKPYIHALYDGELHVFDDMVGRWVAKLDLLGILDKTLIVLVSDHGEELMERGHVGHASCNLCGTLYDESIKIPIIMRLPSIIPAGSIVRTQVSQIDLMPTIFDILGVTSSLTMDGTSMLPLIQHAASDSRVKDLSWRAECFSETTPAGWQALEADDREMWSVRTEKYKLIAHGREHSPDMKYEFYDLVADPYEKKNIFMQNNDACRLLQKTLTSFINRAKRIRK